MNWAQKFNLKLNKMNLKIKNILRLSLLLFSLDSLPQKEYLTLLSKFNLTGISKRTIYVLSLRRKTLNLLSLPVLINTAKKWSKMKYWRNPVHMYHTWGE